MSEQSKTGILILSYIYFTNPEIPVLVAHKENLTSKFKFKTHTSCQYKYISLSFSLFSFYMTNMMMSRKEVLIKRLNLPQDSTILLLIGLY